MKFIAVIPARYASTRFPGKPLVMLGGKTVIERVYTQTKKVIENLFVATDDERIQRAVMEFGGEVVMTRPDHKSGTDRIEEAVSLLEARLCLSADDVVINVQGDEPFIQPSQIETVMRCFEDDSTQIATLGKPFGDNMAAVENPNSPKIAVSQKG